MTHLYCCFLLCCGLLGGQLLQAQTLDEDAEIKYIRGLYKNILTESPAYDWLHYLC